LIGGESGVGKSRLLDELRTHALVKGFIVVRGQAVEGGGLPYQLWREPLRRLALMTALTDLEAGVLKEIVPDVSALLGREVADAPALPGDSGRQRLNVTIVVFKRQAAPMMVLLEDIQWANKGGTLAALDASGIRAVGDREHLSMMNAESTAPAARHAASEIMQLTMRHCHFERLDTGRSWRTTAHCQSSQA
jgi:hypothetical protein